MESKPNLQNIPIKSELGRKIRAAIDPPTKPIICFLCGDEIPVGWPVTFHQNDEGNLQIVHRFRNMCQTESDKSVTPPLAAESNEKDAGITGKGENE